MRLADRLGSGAVLDRAYRWLCKQRRRWPDAADVWSFRGDWVAEKERLRAELRAGTFRFSLLERVEKEDGDEIEVFPARDALVLKALALVLENVLPVSRRCAHVRGHGGAKAAVRRAAVRLRRLPFVICTDVRGYYANIDPVRLIERLACYVRDPEILRLVAALTARTSERGGLFRDSGGLPLGCPLSPLLGAFFLSELDKRLEATGLFFVRFMDDILVLAPTRWKLRRAVKIVNETLAELGLTKHPDKTFIGRAVKGFDFLGYRLSPQGLTVAKQTWQRFAERATRLYEQERAGRRPPGTLREYVHRWRRWLGGGLGPLHCTPGPIHQAGYVSQNLFSEIAYCAAVTDRQGASRIPEVVGNVAEGSDHRWRRRYRPHSVASPVISSATLHGSGTWMVKMPTFAVCRLNPTPSQWVSIGVTN